MNLNIYIINLTFISAIIIDLSNYCINFAPIKISKYGQQKR